MAALHGRLRQHGEPRPRPMTWEDEARALLDLPFALTLFEDAPDAIIVTAKGTMVLVNKQAELMFGYHRSELLGQCVDMLVPESQGRRGRHPSHRQRFYADPRPRPMARDWVLAGQHKDGWDFPVEINLSPTPTSRGVMTIAYIRRPRDRGTDPIPDPPEATSE